MMLLATGAAVCSWVHPTFIPSIVICVFVPKTYQEYQISQESVLKLQRLTNHPSPFRNFESIAGEARLDYGDTTLVQLLKKKWPRRTNVQLKIQVLIRVLHPPLKHGSNSHG